jgi:RNA polymerase sigma factor (sigma-70 family)
MGTPEHFADFCVENWPKLVAYAYSLIADWHLAEDVAQETILAIRHSWERLEEPKHAMWQICRRNTYKVYRENGSGVCSIDNYREEVEEALAQRATQEADVIVERIHQIRELMRLPLRQREIIFLVDLQGLTIVETARVLGIDESSVRYHRNRAMQSLKVAIGDRLSSNHLPRDSRGTDGRG